MSSLNPQMRDPQGPLKANPQVINTKGIKSFSVFLIRARISGSDTDLIEIWLDFWQHIIDVWHVSGVYAACKGSSDLGNGPNKPTATTIGEYSASYHGGALIFTLVRATISRSDQNLA